MYDGARGRRRTMRARRAEKAKRNTNKRSSSCVCVCVCVCVFFPPSFLSPPHLSLPLFLSTLLPISLCLSLLHTHTHTHTHTHPSCRHSSYGHPFGFSKYPLSLPPLHTHVTPDTVRPNVTQSPVRAARLCICIPALGAPRETHGSHSVGELNACTHCPGHTPCRTNVHASPHLPTLERPSPCPSLPTPSRECLPGAGTVLGPGRTAMVELTVSMYDNQEPFFPAPSVSPQERECN